MTIEPDGAGASIMTIRHELLPPPLVEQHARGWAVVAGQLQAQLVAAAALPRAAGQYPLLVWPSGQAEAPREC